MNKSEHLVYNISVKYTNTFFERPSVDYLGPTYFNSMPFEFKKKHTWYENQN